MASSRMQRKMAAAVLAVVALSLSACGNESEAGSNGGDPDSPFIYYASLSVTGPVADYTDATIGGFKMAIDKVNEEGGINGRQVELVVQNDGADPSSAVSLLQKYLSSGKTPDVVYAGSTSAVALSLLPVLTANKIISLSPPSSKETLDKPEDFPYGFSTSVASAESGVFFANEAQDKGFTKVAMLYADTATGQGSLAAFEAALEETDIELVSASYKETALDMSPQLAKLQTEDPDALVLNGYGAPTLYVFKSRSQLGWNLPTYGDQLASSFPLADSLPAAALQNVYVQRSTPTLADTPQPDGMMDFIAEAKSGEHGEQFSAYGWGPYALGWDQIMIARAAAEQAGSTDADDVKELLESGQFEKPSELLGHGKDAQAIDFCYSPDTHFPCATDGTFTYVPPTETNENGFYVPPAS